MSLYVVNSRQVIVPPGFAKVRRFIQGDDLVWLPDTVSWGEVVLHRPELLGRANEGDEFAIIRANENF